jgi:hypothetical protein
MVDIPYYETSVVVTLGNATNTIKRAANWELNPPCSIGDIVRVMMDEPAGG